MCSSMISCGPLVSLARVVDHQVWLKSDLLDPSEEGGYMCSAHQLHPWETACGLGWRYWTHTVQLLQWLSQTYIFFSPPDLQFSPLFSSFRHTPLYFRHTPLFFRHTSLYFRLFFTPNRHKPVCSNPDPPGQHCTSPLPKK